MVRKAARLAMTTNGQVEGPHDHAGQATRAHTVPKRPRSQTDHASRTPPTIVRRHVLTLSYCDQAANNLTRPFQHASAGRSAPFILIGR
jgi:hypothetical protein